MAATHRRRADTPERELLAFVEQRLGLPVRAAQPVAGGCIHRAWRLDLADGRRVFAKTNAADALPLLAAEQQGLEALAPWAPAQLRLPEPLALGRAGPTAVLVLSWLDLASGAGGSTASAAGWAALGAGLAELHRRSAAGGSSAGFGFSTDNFIGATPQRNGWLPEWADFFVQRRLAPQLRLAARRGQPLRHGEAVLERAGQLLAAHHCPAVLVHGDLWSGNAGLLQRPPGEPHGAALFDPATHWADREVDLAMARLFGGFPAAFFDGYGASWPLPIGWSDRLDLYNLYHLLNHANLFGGGYQGQAQSSIDRLLGGAGG
ncbi:MAG: hypothetical protein RLZZ468_864 [Cyanobacteriota bacterium]